MAYIYLVLAICFEVAGTLSLRWNAMVGSYIHPSALLVALFYAASFAFLAETLKVFEVSTVYAVWSGTGIAILALVGYFILGESLSLQKIFGLACIVLGIAALMSSNTHYI